MKDSSVTEQQFLDIFNNQKVNDIIPFLKTLDVNDRTKLGKSISKLAGDTQNSSNYSDTTNDQYTILSIGLFVCLDHSQYKRHRIRLSYMGNRFLAFNDYHQKELMDCLSLDDILSWYCPDWFDKYINNPRDNEDFRCATYIDIMRWYDKGYIKTLSPEMIAETLLHIPFSYTHDENWKGIGHYHPEVLLQHKLTIEEHIWYLFQLPTNICYQAHYMQKNQDWADLFKRLADEGCISRIRLLKETLGALTNTAFNKTQINWFADLFKILEPSHSDLFDVQPELFSALHSPQSKPISMILGYLKEICLNKKFDVADFTSVLPILIVSPTKAIVKSSVSLTEYLLKNKVGDTKELCANLCPGFFNKDEAIQKQIAKVITKYSTPALLLADLSVYAEFILSAIKPLLNDFLITNNPEEIQEEFETIVFGEAIERISEDTKIEMAGNWDDFLFFAMQAFEMNEVCDFSLLPSCLLHFDREMTAERAIQLLPFFKKAIKVKETKWSSKFVSHILTALALSYGKELAKRYPQIADEFKTVVGFNWDMATYAHEHRSNNHMLSFYIQPNYLLFRKVFEALQKGEDYTLLSTPTHSPAWIDPVVLVERLIENKAKGNDPFDTDFELALQRCCLDNTDAALKPVKDRLDGEIRDLLTFFFDKKSKSLNVSNIKHKNWWTTAYLTKYPNTVPPDDIKALLDITTIPEAFFVGNIEWKVKQPKSDYDKPYFDQELPEYEFRDRSGVKFLSEFSYFKALSPNHYHQIWDKDMPYIICNNPYNHHMALQKALACIGSYNGTLASLEKGLLIGALQTLFALNLSLSSADYLFLSIAFLCPDKEVKKLAGSYWIQATQTEVVDNALLGAELGKVINRNWLPVKRFADLIQDDLFNVSKAHNQALNMMLANCIAAMNEPVKDTKKILELYNEMLNICNNKPTQLVVAKLEIWCETAALKKICKTIMD